MFLKCNKVSSSLFFRWDIGTLFLQFAKVHLLDTEGFESTFGKKAQRKKPKLATADIQVSSGAKVFVVISLNIG